MALTKTPIELSSTPGIVDNSNAAAITIDSSERVLIGKTATGLGASGIEINPNGYIQVTEDQSPPLYLNRLNTDGSIVNFYKDGTTVGSIGSYLGSGTSQFYIAGADTGFKINSSVDVIAPSDGSGGTRDAAISLGDAGARFKDLYLSGGVNFSANANAGGMTSETLDDYEEGTWTLASTTPGVTISTQSCRYTKVGRLVTLNGAVTFSALPSNISTQHFSGAPFNCWAQHSVGIVREATFTGTAYILQINANSSTLGMNSYSGVANGSARIFAVNESYIFSLTYTIA